METRQVRKPEWLKAKAGAGPEFRKVRAGLRFGKLNTVCEEARCPNLGKCWEAGTATFMVLGKVCTRNCLFCSVESSSKGQALDGREPAKVAEAVREFGLKYAVLTSVDRDDLPDLGAGHFSECIKAVKATGAKAEALIPDFQGRADCLQRIVEAGPDVIGHNVEVVKRLQKTARDARAGYRQSLAVLSKLKELDESILTKSSIMLGLGEKSEEVLQAMADLRKAGVDLLTLGQYLQPSRENLPVAEFVKPEKFKEYEKAALEKGFLGVFSGPLVRSSFRAGEMYERAKRA
jgi:lipoic acid synthetase